MEVDCFLRAFVGLGSVETPLTSEREHAHCLEMAARRKSKGKKTTRHDC